MANNDQECFDRCVGWHHLRHHVRRLRDRILVGVIFINIVFSMWGKESGYRNEIRKKEIFFIFFSTVLQVGGKICLSVFLSIFLFNPIRTDHLTSGNLTLCIYTLGVH